MALPVPEQTRKDREDNHGALVFLDLQFSWLSAGKGLCSGYTCGASGPEVYAVHWAFETTLGIRFWDYANVPGKLRGRVCLPFTLAWGILTAAAVWWIQPWVERLASRIPPEATFFCLLLFTADALLSARFLWVTGDIEGLRSLS